MRARRAGVPTGRGSLEQESFQKIISENINRRRKVCVSDYSRNFLSLVWIVSCRVPVAKK